MKKLLEDSKNFLQYVKDNGIGEQRVVGELGDNFPMLTNITDDLTENKFTIDLAESLMAKMQKFMAELSNLLVIGLVSRSTRCIKEFMNEIAKFGVLIARLSTKDKTGAMKALKDFAIEFPKVIVKCYTPF